LWRAKNWRRSTGAGRTKMSRPAQHKTGSYRRAESPDMRPTIGAT
jgi:hypothetical protein